MSVAICTCLLSGSMSGASRSLTRTDGSIFFASAKAAPLSSTAEKAVSMVLISGTVAWYMDKLIGFPPYGRPTPQGAAATRST